MSDELSPRVREIFSAAVQMETSRRAAFLDEACGADAALRARLESLLSHHDRAGSFLEEPALGADFRLEKPATLEDESPPHDRGDRIGPFEIEGLIGAGGMARVYLARHADPEISKRAAIKVIRPGMDTEAVVGRFRIERRALANLDHPNIARFLEGGATPAGLPYLAMEFIEGEPIDVYCDRRKLTTTRRLELFRSVCAAVQYAHAKLVLHRDIKPGNILVTNEGVPKLLDFGIAKLLAPEGDTPPMPVTTRTQRFFTAEYASPEQIRGESVTTATDIYSLGVVLYELLTGHRPYTVSRRAPAEVERIVCEEIPTRPSSVIFRVTEGRPPSGESNAPTPESVSLTRDGKPERLRRRLAGDVDTIVLMALRKEPERRYASVEQLSEDIRRHLAGLPVLARRDTVRYRALKFITRHRAAILSAVLLAVLVIGAISVSVRDALRVARDQREAAGRVQDRLLQLHEERTREGFLDAFEELDVGRVADGLRSQPRELIRFADTVASVCERFHLGDLAAGWRRRALDALADAPGTSGAELAGAHLRLARALVDSAQVPEAEEHLRQAAELRRGDPRSPGPPPLVEILRDLASVLWLRGDAVASRSVFEEALRLDRSASTLLDFAAFLEETGHESEAEALLREALELASRPPEGDRTIAVATVQHRLGALLWSSPRFHDAEPLLRGALTAFLRGLPEEDPRVAACLDDLAIVLARTRTRRAERVPWEVSPFIELWRRARNARVVAFGEESLEVAASIDTLSRLVSATEGGPHCRRAAELYGRWLSEDHPRLAGPLTHLGYYLTVDRTGRVREGEAVLRRALAIRGLGLPPDHWKTAITAGFLGRNLAAQGRHEEAERLLRESVGRLENALGELHPVTLSLLWLLVESLEAAQGEDSRRREFEARANSSLCGDRFRDDDGFMEVSATIDFEDDHVEKRIEIARPPRTSRARLWVFGRAENYPWEHFRERQTDHFRIRVNGDPEQEVAFNAGISFLFTVGFQWVPFEIPEEWIVEGSNTFAFYKAHDPDWESKRSWLFNNLRIGVDTDTNHDRSWWFGSLYTCCREIVDIAEDPATEKPLSRSAPFIEEHREKGYRECQGELMVYLELCER